MLLTISTTHRPASDLSFLLHKHPDRVQSFNLNFGRATVFYPEVSEDRCQLCLMLLIDGVSLVRRAPDPNFVLGQYVNDRPYTASSFMSVAISQVLGSALNGRSQSRPDLVQQAIPLTARLDVLSVRGGESFLKSIFEPLGYCLEIQRHSLDEKFPEWGDSPYYSITISQSISLSELLQHLYVLIPVFDTRKHYFIGEAEVEKLLEKGNRWLAQHPLREEITRRYLGFRPSLVRAAIQRLVDDSDEEEVDSEIAESSSEPVVRLNDQRIQAVVQALRDCRAERVLDLGCGEGRLLRELITDQRFQSIVGMDVSIRSLEIANRRLKLETNAHSVSPANLTDSWLAHVSRRTIDRFRRGVPCGSD